MRVAMQAASVIGLVVAAGVARADDTACILRSGWPEPLCVAPATPRDTARVKQQVALKELDGSAWQRGCEELERSLPQIDHDGELDVRVRSRVALGERHQRAGKMAEAVSAWEQAISLWRSPRAAAWVRGPQHPDLSPARLHAVLEDVGRAVILIADQHRATTVDALTFPVYVGPPEIPFTKRLEDMTQEEFQHEIMLRKEQSERVKKFIDVKVKLWVETKLPAIRRAEGHYQRVLEIAPSPPASALIAANQRIGPMWAEFVADFRKAPIPTWMKKDDELRVTHSCGGDPGSEPIKQRAKAYFSKCLELSVRNGTFTDDSQNCENWLSRNYKAEFQRLDDFAPPLLDTPSQRAIPPQPARLITLPHPLAR